MASFGNSDGAGRKHLRVLLPFSCNTLVKANAFSVAPRTGKS
jgi:hypothetical protein